MFDRLVLFVILNANPVASSYYVMTIDELAVLIQNTVAKKEDLASLATKVDVVKVGDRMDALEQKFDALEQKVDEGFRILNEQIKMLNFSVEIDDLRRRMRKVEEKLGIR